MYDSMRTAGRVSRPSDHMREQLSTSCSSFPARLLKHADEKRRVCLVTQPYDTMALHVQPLSSRIACMLQLAPIVAVFYAAYFLATNYIILNLIIGTVLEQFIVRNEEKRKLQRRDAIRTAANLQVPCELSRNLAPRLGCVCPAQRQCCRAGAVLTIRGLQQHTDPAPSAGHRAAGRTGVLLGGRRCTATGSLW